MNTVNTIIVPADKISYLKSKSNLFNTLISNNFSNSKDYFTKNGDYIIKKETIIPLNKNPSHKELIARNKVFEQLRRALMGEYIPNENDAEYIKEFFMFNKNFNFYDPTLKEQPYIGRNKKNITHKNKVNKSHNSNNSNNYGYNTNNTLHYISKKNKHRNNVKIGNYNENYNTLNIVKTAKKTYSKYPKSGKRPSKYNKYRTTQKLYKD